jgi:hypothetical protein
LWILVLLVVLLAGGGAAYALSQPTRMSLACSGSACATRTGSPKTGSRGTGGTPARAVQRGADAFRVSSTTPTPGATGIASDAKLTVTFDSALDSGGPTPTLSPAVAGSWQQVSADRLVFSPSAPFVPFETYTLRIPGGPDGMRSASGARLRADVAVKFTIANGSVLRLQQLLAELGYLPVTYSGATPPPQELATPQPGGFTWRWPGLPPELTGQWLPGYQNALTKGAVMMFETENGLSVDGIAGPEVWSTLLRDVVSRKTNTEPVTYVLVTKVEPEHLTAWVNGVLRFRDIPVNTGVPGANTTDGTFQVFEHVPYSDMRGVNVTGSKYTDPHVPWASYFNGGDALHGFPRATYGWPQSNGCVEMPIATAGKLWPYTPIGTLVTVMGPSSGGTAPATTTTAPATTTTTPATSSAVPTAPATTTPATTTTTPATTTPATPAATTPATTTPATTTTPPATTTTPATSSAAPAGATPPSPRAPAG